MAGAILLRDSAGYVYAIQTDALQQVDLSDDLVLLLVFSDGEWEGLMAPIQYEQEDGKSKQLQIEAKEFREMLGILKQFEEEGGEEQQQ